MLNRILLGVHSNGVDKTEIYLVAYMTKGTYKESKCIVITMRLGLYNHNRGCITVIYIHINMNGLSDLLNYAY